MPDFLRLPDLNTLCVEVLTGPGELCVEFPGGTTLCASAGIDTGDALEMVRSLLGQVNSALMPLIPFFNLLDVIKVIADCIQAIPDAITSLDPSGILECIPNLVQKLDELLKLIPALTIPVLVKSLLGVIITGLIGLRAKLRSFIAQTLRIAAAATRAAELGGGIDLQLQAVVDCAQRNLEAQLENENAALLPLNRLIGLVNLLLKLAGLPCVPTIGGIAAISEDVIAPLDAVIAFLQGVQAAIPVKFELPGIPGPEEPCD